MSCSQAQWLHGYFDGELDAARAAEFEAHLASCRECPQALATQQALRDALGAADVYAKAPASLRARVRGELPASLASGARRRTGWSALAAAASLALVFGLWRSVPNARDAAVDREQAQVIDAHLRSLQAAHLTDVASSDRHTVKPWFAGKLDFAPVVVDLASDGFPLVGGRLEVVGGRSVAALVYGRRQHVINVFVWPVEAKDAALETGERSGFRWIRWTAKGMRFWVVSDVAAPEIQEFARRLAAS